TRFSELIQFAESKVRPLVSTSDEMKVPQQAASANQSNASTMVQVDGCVVKLGTGPESTGKTESNVENLTRATSDERVEIGRLEANSPPEQPTGPPSKGRSHPEFKPANTP